MNKNIKRMLSVTIITMSMFSLIGCQSKEEAKQEIKLDESKVEEQVKIEEIKSITKESLAKFEGLYKEYFASTIPLTKFKLPTTDPNYITIEQSKELKVQSDIIKENLIQATPEALKETMKNAIRMREEYINANYENREKELPFATIEESNGYNKIIKDKVAEFHTQID